MAEFEALRFLVELSEDYATSCECERCYWIVVPSFIDAVAA